ncbi:MAG TPA: OmpA family protein [Bryobacteraceae bacterium]|nr:OmpA family protein [Bryobacteraceae bacterium]
MKKYSLFRASLFFALLCLILAFVGCSKKPPIPPPPPPPSVGNTTAPGPTNGPVIAEFTAEPAAIELGQSALLRWSVSGANDISIDHGIGSVQATGTSRVSPRDTTTYTLIANGPGGTSRSAATVRIVSPPPPPPPVTRENTSARGTFETRVASDLQDALFDYDSNNIRDDARAALTADADAMKRIFIDFPGTVINVEGHCDERGSAEYNLGLGDRRASSARDFLVQLGVPADRLKTISYGKERPACTESNESCWQRNRRAHFSSGQ